MAQNTKTPPKPANKPAAKAKPPATVEDLDNEDDLDGDEAASAEASGDEAAATNGASSWKATMRLPPAKRVAVRLGNLVDRVQHQIDAMKNWAGEEQEAVKAAVQQVQDGLKAAAERLTQIPDDWRPARSGGGGGGGGPKVEIVVGTLVRITDKRLPEYQDIVSPECARGIKVTEVRGNKVVGLMSDGVKAMIPRGHVTVDTEAMAAAS